MISVYAFITFLTFWSLAHSQCVYTSSECTCSEQPAGNICLKRNDALSVLGAEVCDAYVCSSGYVCDCSGTEVCDVVDCTATREVFRATGISPTAVGDIVSCEAASQVTCVNSRVISPTPSPSGSASASPSISTTPSSTPSPAILPLGAQCDGSIDCISGSSCNCIGRCARDINITITGFGAANLEAWMCDSILGATTTTNSYDRLTVTWQGTCSDLYFKVRDEGNVTGVVAAVRNNDDFGWFPTTVDGSGLSGTYFISPPNRSFMTDPNYDFSAWGTPVNSTLLSGEAGYRFIMSSYDADVWTYRDTVVSNTFQGISWYRAPLPFCYA